MFFRNANISAFWLKQVAEVHSTSARCSSTPLLNGQAERGGNNQFDHAKIAFYHKLFTGLDFFTWLGMQPKKIDY